MKAPKFWFEKDSLAAQLLSPASALYEIAGQWRRAMATPYQAGVPVICVGNVTAGGAGKTPTALALASLLKAKGHNPGFVTRGYGGSQHGPLRVDPAHHGTEEVGDEAMLLIRRAPVWIGRDRAAAIREAEKSSSHIILDDGLQNPNIKPDIALLVIDGAVGIGNGRVIPAGPLREPLEDALQRATAVLVIGDGGIATGGKPLLRGHLAPVIPADFPRDAAFLAFAGIGRPKKFYDLCRKAGLNIAATMDFADHHPFKSGELQRLERTARERGAKLLTTEKDFVRLPAWFQERVATFPVELKFEDLAAIEKLLNI